MKARRWIILTVFFCQTFLLFGQVDAPNEGKAWYSLSLSKKINHKWSLQNFSLLGTRSFRNDFWFFQNDFSVNFNVNRLVNVSLGYGHTLYKYNAWWSRHYPQQPNFMNAVSFHSLSAAIERRWDIGRKFRLSNDLIIQYYVPRFEKYQTRFHYTAGFSYRKRDLPLGMKPFVQGAVYYYMNGEKTYYYDENFNITSYASPDGIHRFRGKVGFNFRPAKKVQGFSITLYYGINREFNMKGLGKDLNVAHLSPTGRTMLIANPFNNYDIAGLQFGISF